MAAHPILVMDDEILRKLPENFKSDPRYQRGASMELIPLQAKGSGVSLEETMQRWESLRGIVSDSDLDPNAELEREKQQELAKEARWMDG